MWFARTNVSVSVRFDSYASAETWLYEQLESLVDSCQIEQGLHDGNSVRYNVKHSNGAINSVYYGLICW